MRLKYIFHNFYLTTFISQLFRSVIVEKEELKKIAEQDLIEGRTIIDKMKARRDEMFEFDKSFEKHFKKEFPGLGFNQLEALMKCFKKRPKGVAVAIEQHLALSSGKDFRKSHDSLAAYGAAGAQRHGGKDLKAKSIAAALERVSTNLVSKL